MPETVFDKKTTGISASCNVRVTSLYRAEGVPVAFFFSIPTCPDIKTLYALVKKATILDWNIPQEPFEKTKWVVKHVQGQSVLMLNTRSELDISVYLEGFEWEMFDSNKMGKEPPWDSGLSYRKGQRTGLSSAQFSRSVVSDPL